MKPHHWEHKKGLGRPMCVTCGLVALKNDASQRAVSRPCRGERVEIWTNFKIWDPIKKKWERMSGDC